MKTGKGGKLTMATKGPSNRYTNTNGSAKRNKNADVAFAWAKRFAPITSDDHYERHASNTSLKTKESYETHAVKFANIIDKKNCVTFVDPATQKTYKYNKETNELAVITKKGIVITYYKPRKGYNYYIALKRKLGGKLR